MRNITKSLTFIGAMLVASQSQALLIDSFNDTTQTVSWLNAPISSTVTTASGEAIGDYRRVEIRNSSGPLNTSASVVAGTGLGIFSHSEDVATSGTSRVTWNAGGNGLNVNLTANNTFILDTLTIDQGKMDVTIGLTDNDSTDFVTLSNITGINPMPTISFYSFSGIDFNSINTIYLEINAGQASDITLDEIRTMGGHYVVVPEPATFLLMGAGLVGLVSMHRRKATR